MKNVKWFRVTDPLSPLCGCDVKLSGIVVSHIDFGDDIVDDVRKFHQVVAMRKVDVFVGDRPFQLVAKEGQDLGLLICEDQLSESPFQNDVMEIGRDRPFGLCINESEMTRGDGCKMSIARYEHATQIAFQDKNGKLLATATEVEEHTRDVWEETVLTMFETNVDQDNITYALRSN